MNRLSYSVLENKQYKMEETRHIILTTNSIRTITEENFPKFNINSVTTSKRNRRFN